MPCARSNELAQLLFGEPAESQGAMKPVGSETPEWEISDWPVKLTGMEGNMRLYFCSKKGAPSLGIKVSTTTIFPVQSTLSLLKHARRPVLMKTPG